MENNALIDALPLWGLFIAILGVVLISVEWVPIEKIPPQPT